MLKSIGIASAFWVCSVAFLDAQVVEPLGFVGRDWGSEAVHHSFTVHPVMEIIPVTQLFGELRLAHIEADSFDRASIFFGLLGAAAGYGVGWLVMSDVADSPQVGLAGAFLMESLMLPAGISAGENGRPYLRDAGVSLLIGAAGFTYALLDGSTTGVTATLIAVPVSQLFVLLRL